MQGNYVYADGYKSAVARVAPALCLAYCEILFGKDRSAKRNRNPKNPKIEIPSGLWAVFYKKQKNPPRALGRKWIFSKKILIKDKKFQSIDVDR